MTRDPSWINSSISRLIKVKNEAYKRLQVGKNAFNFLVIKKEFGDLEF